MTSIDRTRYAQLRKDGLPATWAAQHARHDAAQTDNLEWDICFPQGEASWITEHAGQEFMVTAQFDYDEVAPSYVEEHYGCFTNRYRPGALRNPHSVGQEDHYCSWFVPADSYDYAMLRQQYQAEGNSRGVADYRARREIALALARAYNDDERTTEYLDLVVTVRDARGRRVGREALGGIEVQMDLSAGDLASLSAMARDLLAQILE